MRVSWPQPDRVPQGQETILNLPSKPWASVAGIGSAATHWPAWATNGLTPGLLLESCRLPLTTFIDPE